MVRVVGSVFQKWGFYFVITTLVGLTTMEILKDQYVLWTLGLIAVLLIVMSVGVLIWFLVKNKSKNGGDGFNVTASYDYSKGLGPQFKFAWPDVMQLDGNQTYRLLVSLDDKVVFKSAQLKDTSAIAPYLLQQSDDGAQLVGTVQVLDATGNIMIQSHSSPHTVDLSQYTAFQPTYQSSSKTLIVPLPKSLSNANCGGAGSVVISAFWDSLAFVKTTSGWDLNNHPWPASNNNCKTQMTYTLSGDVVDSHITVLVVDTSSKDIPRGGWAQLSMPTNNIAFDAFGYSYTPTEPYLAFP